MQSQTSIYKIKKEAFAPFYHYCCFKIVLILSTAVMIPATAVNNAASAEKI